MAPPGTRAVERAVAGLPAALSAISVGDQLNGLFWTDTTLVPAISSIGAFSFVTDTRYKNDRTYQLQALQNIYNQAGNFSPFESTFTGGLFVAAGDLSKDGKADVVVSPDQGGGPRVEVYDTAGAGDTVVATVAAGLAQRPRDLPRRKLPLSTR